MKNGDDMELSSIIAVLIMIVVLSILAVLLIMRYQEHSAALYERRMAANAHLVSMVRDQGGMKITIYRDGRMTLDTSANDRSHASNTTPTASLKSRPSDADALAEAARLLKASIADPSCVARNQIMPANKWSSAELWQRAVDALRARDLLLDINSNGQRGTYPAAGLTLADVLEAIGASRGDTSLMTAVKSLPQASRTTTNG